MIQPFVILFAHTVEYLFPKGFDISFSDIHLSRHNKHFVKRQCACLWMCKFFFELHCTFWIFFQNTIKICFFFLFIVQRLLKFTCTSNKLLLGSLYGSFFFIFQDFFISVTNQSHREEITKGRQILPKWGSNFNECLIYERLFYSFLHWFTSMQILRTHVIRYYVENVLSLKWQ